VSDLLLFVGLIALWLAIAWVIFRRVGFFGAQKAPRFSVHKDGNHYDSRMSRYLINGITGGRHIVYVFETPEGTPFVYLPRDKDVQVLDGSEGLETYVREHCGGEKGIAKLAETRARDANK